MEQLEQCPACKEKSFLQFLQCEDYTVSHETFSIVQCTKCGFKFTNPRPDENEIAKYYEAENYISHSNTNQGIVNSLYQLIRKYTIAKKVQLINRLTHPCEPNKRTILDFGCGTGEFLNACKINGWAVNGIEPSDKARIFGTTHYDLSIDTPDSFFSIAPKSFLVITLWHVLEHLHKLDKTVEQIKNTLRDDGKLIIAVPNGDSLDAKIYGRHWAAYDVPRHFYHFNSKNIQELFSQHNFKLEKILPMKFDSYYVSMLSEKYKNGKQRFIKGMRNGFLSNISAMKRGENYSSQIYIFSKEK